MKPQDQLEHYQALIRNLLTLATSYRNQYCQGMDKCLCDRCEKLRKLRETVEQIGVEL